MVSRDEVTFDEPDMDLELEAGYKTEETSDATLALDGFEVLGGDCSSTSFIFTKASKGSKSDQLNKKDTDTTEAVKGRQIDWSDTLIFVRTVIYGTFW